MEKKDSHKENAAKGHDEGKQPHGEEEKKHGEGKPTFEEGKKPAAALGMEEFEKKLSEATERLLRISAEFDNYKKRTAKEKEQLAHGAEGKLMLRMLPVYEEIGLAEKEASKIESEPVRTGVLMVLSKLRQSFEKEGLSEMKLEGEKLDPFRHDVAMREDSELPEGTIVRVIQNGYLFRGEVLRHAVVSVSSGKKAGEKGEIIMDEMGKKQENAAGKKTS